MTELDTVVLTDLESTMTATFVPSAGMIGTSLSDGDAEFLGQRRGLDAYLANAKTMGIPLLYPWANRLGAKIYDVDGGAVTLTPGAGGVRVDEHGAPIHGVLAAYPGWLVTEQSPNSLTATLDFSGRPGLLASFPFPHILTQRVTLADRTLTIETAVRPTTAASVPLCFGYHPYLTIPGVPREDWILETPTLRHLPTDDQGLPTGAVETWPARSGPLGDTTYDDGFDQVPDGTQFAISGGGHRITVTFETGYPAAQLFAPPSDALVAIEPMAAPTDALRRGNYRVAAPGRPAIARFSVSVY
ncbi:aldose 1-epimerase [Mycobacterium sp. CBMA293]|uniref:aldose 1-epimerase n=1 Tax=unclassified Mycolicibacterium TaxID=2636767 RepID=UPI0012DF9688|nr:MULTISPECIES: aldose 1-epimerase [unclassified Mycolicibacterium]MUL47749.1 aldose 1-epimerase [Mycolicibacterium sp. CBMA 360]MUL61733.1 aldose 1-epimerase [Mycolicibacterium sp. CBMA 335]MUL70797.1 aldose 1-epimerase [Mycolicibacterium sp. CBMA 311]MUL92977.1 aldose 1-epimerase [Mycolicibacterium sp. CBMA 230]MUM08581.1 aldose epimerase [Mycolicibacterium sp. CBMA 213]